MFRRLLITTDFADGLHRLVNFIPELAQAGFEEVVFLHCVPLLEGNIPQVDEKKQAQVQAQLAPALENIPEGMQVQIELPSSPSKSSTAQAILNAVHQHQSDLVIVGMPTHNLLDEKLFGSTTSTLAQKIAVPVLILRPQLVSAYTVEELSLRCQHLFRFLLIPYDGSASAGHVIDFVTRQTQAHPPQEKITCLLCWVLEKTGKKNLGLQPQSADCEQSLQGVKQRLETSDLQVETQIRHGNAIAEIEAVALESDTSVIVVSSRHFGRLLELSIPSFAGEILRRSWHPILFVPPAR